MVFFSVFCSPKATGEKKKEKKNTHKKENNNQLKKNNKHQNKKKKDKTPVQDPHLYNIIISLKPDLHEMK